MSVKRAQQEIDSAEFSEWMARDLVLSGHVARPVPEQTDEERRNAELMAMALEFQARANARPH